MKLTTRCEKKHTCISKPYESSTPLSIYQSKVKVGSISRPPVPIRGICADRHHSPTTERSKTLDSGKGGQEQGEQHQFLPSSKRRLHSKLQMYYETVNVQLYGSCLNDVKYIILFKPVIEQRELLIALSKHEISGDAAILASKLEGGITLVGERDAI
jgi:hypothetical protein